MRLLKLCLVTCLAAGVSSVSFAGETLSQAPQLAAVVSAALKEFEVPGATIGVWTPNGHWVMATGLRRRRARSSGQ